MPLLVVVAAYALLVPLYGPLLDHHFVERHFGHLHLYPGGVAVEHLHSYQTPHDHGEPSPGLGAEASDSGIRFLPPDEEGMPGADGLSFAVAVLMALLVVAAASNLAPVFLANARAFQDFIPPPESPPPRSA